MTASKSKSEPQLQLGLHFSGLRLLEYIRFRFKKLLIFLDQLSFWRAPALWLIFFLNGTASYMLFNTIRSERSVLPPNIPLLFFADTTYGSLLSTDSLMHVLIIQLLFQLLIVILAFRISLRLKQLSKFMLIISILSSTLFYITLYKSLWLTLPIGK